MCDVMNKTVGNDLEAFFRMHIEDRVENGMQYSEIYNKAFPGEEAKKKKMYERFRLHNGKLTLGDAYQISKAVGLNFCDLIKMFEIVALDSKEDISELAKKSPLMRQTKTD